MSGMTRRSFLKSTAVLVAGTMAAGKVFGANDRIGICVIGFNGQGASHIKDILGKPDQAEIVALCDVDKRVLKRGVQVIKAKTGKEPKPYEDFREAVNDPNVHAVTIATPNHSHTVITVLACKAGKDVYVEKPLSHNIWEGTQVVEAAKKYGRIVQHGTQNRSNPTLIRDMQLIRKGFIGKIVHSRGYVYKNGNRHAIGHGIPGDPPEYLNWTLWQCTSPDRPFLKNKDFPDKPGLYVHYDWHWFWEYGNGEIGNQGVHEMDIACWAHNRGLPVQVYSTGGRYGWDDDGETPNTQVTTFTYADGSILSFEVRNLGSFQEADGGECGNSIFGTDGYYVRNKGFFDYKNKPIQVNEPLPEDLDKWDRFFKAIRSRKEEDLPVTPLEAHISCAHCHLGNIAYRLKRSLEFDPQNLKFKDEEANKLIKRAQYREGFEPIA